MNEAVILAGARTSFGSFGGSLKDFSSVDLGTLVSTEVIKRASISLADVEEVIFGNVIQTGQDSAYLARHILLKTGIPPAVPALTVNRLCGSGMEAIIQAARKILLDEAKVLLAGGVETMSQAPYVVRNARWGMKYGNGDLEDSLATGLTDNFIKMPMGMTAENLAEKYKISREEQDEWASVSQVRAENATANGIFEAEIIPVPIGKKGELFSKDEFIRGKASTEKLPSLKPVFKENGSVTAGNSSGINDGASAVIVTSKEHATKLGIQPLAIIKSYSHTGCEPKIMGIGPAIAIPLALQKAGLTLKDIGLFEINEAFSAQFLAVKKELGLNPAKTNVNGGAIAIGHPLGASGNRITLTLALEMKRRNVKYGVASLCIGGGQGIAILIENPEGSI